MNFIEIDTILRNYFTDNNFSGIINTIDKIKELVNLDAECYDQYIDDGADGADDNYVMCASFELENGIIMRIYYGDVTNIIGYVDIIE